MKTRLEQLAVELRSLATGVEGVQPELDKQEDKIEDLQRKLDREGERMVEMEKSYSALQQKDKWKAVASETPRLDVEVITRDENGTHHIATYEGSAGWFSGNTRLANTPRLWFSIPKR